MATASSWYRRSALMYTVGAWTIMGYIIYRASSYMTTKKEEAEEQPFSPEKDSSDYEMDFLKTFTKPGQSEITTYRKPGSSFSVVTTISSKPDFVPYSIRIQNYVESFFYNRGGKEE